MIEISILIPLILTIIVLLFIATRQHNKFHEKEELHETRMRQMENSFAAERRVFIEKERTLRAEFRKKEKKFKDAFHEEEKLQFKTPPPEISSGNTYWYNLSRWLRHEKRWRCEECGINLVERQRDLHVHHIFGRAYNSPQHLKVLCRACHADEPDHDFMKRDTAYTAFLEWKRRRHHQNSVKGLKVP